MSVISTTTDTLTATIPVGSGPLGVAVTPGHPKAYVTNSNSKSVSVINTATDTPTATIPVGSEPLDVAFGTVGKVASTTTTTRR